MSHCKPCVGKAKVGSIISICNINKNEKEKRIITIFSDIRDAKLFPPTTAATVHNACPL